MGARLGEIATSGYTLLDIPNPRQRLAQVFLDPTEPGRVYRPELAVVASAESFLAALAELTPPDPPWTDWTASARADYQDYIRPRDTPGSLKLERVIAWLRDHLPRDAVLANGAGNYTAWVHRYYPYGSYRCQLAPRCGSMGYGLPTAPERTVICFAGDGCFLMTGQELATAAQYGLGGASWW